MEGDSGVVREVRGPGKSGFTIAVYNVLRCGVFG